MAEEVKFKGYIARDKFVQWTSNGPIFDGIGALVFYIQNQKNKESTHGMLKVTKFT